MAFRRTGRQAALLSGCGLLLSGCSQALSPLAPGGPAASAVADLIWLLFWLGGAVFIVVSGLLAYAIWHRRQTEEPNPSAVAPADAGVGSRFVLIGGAVLPGLILLVVWAVSLQTMRAVPQPSGQEPLQIQVIGHQWWWEVAYPRKGFISANEIHIPAGQPVEIVLTSADVIHSFWIPRLHGIVDMIPGDENRLQITADEPGVYRGECTEYCGLQHAKMMFVLVALPPQEFDAWLARQQQPAPPPQTASQQQGQNLYFAKGCDECHAIAGTAASGRLGPDLTHIASRRTLAAGWIDNNRENLGDWILNPHTIKSGVLMPANDYSEAELQALLDYLSLLE